MPLPDRIELSTSLLPMEWRGFEIHAPTIAYTNFEATLVTVLRDVVGCDAAARSRATGIRLDRPPGEAVWSSTRRTIFNYHLSHFSDGGIIRLFSRKESCSDIKCGHDDAAFHSATGQS
jgi:hypothetical protein